MKIYTVAVGTSTAEIEALQACKPPYLLLSFYYFRNKPLQEYLFKLGYKPTEIFLDSGAYSAFTKGKGIALTDYMAYIDSNPEITAYISLDVIGDEVLSFEYYRLMKLKNYNPIPVVHCSPNWKSWLQRYYEQDERFIALGGTVPIKSKLAVAAWVNEVQAAYPDVRFHLLGSTCKKILDNCSIYSCDSSSWFQGAVVGRPRHIKGTSRAAKIERAIFNLKGEMLVDGKEI
jgi:hypothetical protein